MRIELEKKPVTMKLSKEARLLIAKMGQKQGMNATAVVESAIRRVAELEGIKLVKEAYEQEEG